MKRAIQVSCIILPAISIPASLRGQVSPSETDRTTEIRELKLELQRISSRLDQLEKQELDAKQGIHTSPPANDDPHPVVETGDEAKEASPPAESPVVTKPADTALSRATTFGIGFDGYYGYNFNQPIGRVNLLRAYDVSSNSFSINQVSLIAEHLPTADQRFGGRVDLQFGQATETLQGSSSNEQRPQVYRNLFQAYGSYLAPLGNGLQIDFGKFASALGNEGNYTKDQIAYSRAYSFNFLPFYHMGARLTYSFSPKASFAYWLVNGADQTEDFNGFKSQAFLWTLRPASSLTWNVNYYFGQEQRDVQPTIGVGTTSAPTQPGLPTENISPAPNGREHIFDTYATWNATRKLTMIGEADFVLNRRLAKSQPGRVAIGALYAKYALPRNSSVAARFEYFDDRNGLFSGATQALKEFTVVGDHTFAAGFLARAEYRRDFSNQRFFLSDQSGLLLHAQTTATLGLVYWWGTKQGSW